jgi:hypothetical protein
MIYQMLALNPAHLRKKTFLFLKEEIVFHKLSCLTVTQYGKDGFVIKIDTNDFAQYNQLHPFDIPDDLQAIIYLAIDSGCRLVCIAAHEKDVLKHLPYYQYDNRPDEYGCIAEFEDCYCCNKLIGSNKVHENKDVNKIENDDDVDLSTFFRKKT